MAEAKAVTHQSITSTSAPRSVERPKRQQQNIDDFPHLRRGKEAIQARQATIRAYTNAKEVNPSPHVATAEERRILFGQSKETVR